LQTFSFSRSVDWMVVNNLDSISMIVDGMMNFWRMIYGVAGISH
jgi:hypothetical protein